MVAISNQINREYKGSETKDPTMDKIEKKIEE